MTKEEMPQPQSPNEWLKWLEGADVTSKVESLIQKILGQWQNQASDLIKEVKEADDAFRAATTARNKAEERATLYAQQMEDLKVRVHTLEIQAAKQAGYIDRVAEDDQVRDGIIEIKESDGTHVRPRRPPRPSYDYDFQGEKDFYTGGGEPSAYDPSRDQYGRTRPTKRVHWANYGS